MPRYTLSPDLQTCGQRSLVETAFTESIREPIIGSLFTTISIIRIATSILIRLAILSLMNYIKTSLHLTPSYWHTVIYRHYFWAHIYLSDSSFGLIQQPPLGVVNLIMGCHVCSIKQIQLPVVIDARVPKTLVRLPCITKFPYTHSTARPARPPRPCSAFQRKVTSPSSPGPTFRS